MKMYEEIMDQKHLFKRLDPYLQTKKESLTKKINESRNIVMFATGASLNACIASTFAFVKHLEKKPIIIPASEANQYLEIISSNDLIVVVSQSGDSFETKMICELLNSKKLDFIGITNEENSTLANKATDVLLLHAQDEISSATKTYTATIYILFFLATILTKDNYLLNINEVVSEILESKLDMAEIVETISAENYMYVLSDAINYSTARATALLLKEKDLILAEAMTLSEFRHGAVEVVKEGFVCFIIVSDESYKSEFLKHLAFLRAIKATIICVSSYNIENSDNIVHLQLPTLKNNVFSPLTMILPSQLISLEIASKLNLNADSFIYLNKVLDIY